jgi:hypothetical protein
MSTTEDQAGAEITEARPTTSVMTAERIASTSITYVTLIERVMKLTQMSATNRQ